MLTKGKFLVSFDIIEKDRIKGCFVKLKKTKGKTQELEIAYRTEQLRPYLIYPNIRLEPNHTHYKYAREKLLKSLKAFDIEIIDLIPLP